MTFTIVQVNTLTMLSSHKECPHCTPPPTILSCFIVCPHYEPSHSTLLPMTLYLRVRKTFCLHTGADLNPVTTSFLPTEHSASSACFHLRQYPGEGSWWPLASRVSPSSPQLTWTLLFQPPRGFYTTVSGRQSSFY